MNQPAAYISVDIPGHGYYGAVPMFVDMMIAKHLPASPADLRAIVQERTGEELDYSDVKDVASFLIILADWEQASFANAYGPLKERAE